MSKIKKPSVDRDTIRIFWRTGLLSKRWFILSFLFPLGAIFFSVVTPYYIGKTLAALTHPSWHPQRYLVFFAVSAVIWLVSNRIGFLRPFSLQAKNLRHLQSQ